MLDYCVSLTLIHLVLISKVSGIPLVWQWWVIKLSVLVLQLLGTRFIVSQLVLPLSVPPTASLHVSISQEV